MKCEHNDLLIEKQHRLLCTGSVAPVSHQLQSDCEHREHFHTGCTHVIVRVLSSLSVKGARRVAIGEDTVAFGSQRQCKKSCADLRESLRSLWHWTMLNKVSDVRLW